NDIALFYIEKNNVNIEIVLNHCFMAPNIVGFILPQQEKGTFCFAIRSKCALGNTSHDEISLLTFSSNDTQMARNQLFGNLLTCDRDLLRSAQMAASNTMMQPAPTSTHSSGASSHHSRFSMVKQDLIRKTSKSTFKNFFALTSHGHKQKQSEAKNKAHTSSTVSSTSSPSQNSHLGKARASTSGYSEYVLNLEATSRSSSVYSGSLKSQRSHESRLPPGSSNKDEKLLSQFHSSLHRFASESNQKRNYSPSFHPTRTASFDIESAATKKTFEELGSAFHYNNLTKLDCMLTSRSRSPLSMHEPTPTMTESGSGYSTLNSRCSSTLSTFNNINHSPLTPYSASTEQPPMHHRLIENAISNRPTSDLIIPIATPTNGEGNFYSNENFSSNKTSCEASVYLELEEKNKTILFLSSLLQKKEEEIELLKADLEDSVAELGTVCDVSELENHDTNN
ncbi:hypothetical protein CU098_010863, partial [Rhizopus stolonifer]